jgi:hypothetical protein
MELGERHQHSLKFYQFHTFIGRLTDAVTRAVQAIIAEVGNASKECSSTPTSLEFGCWWLGVLLQSREYVSFKRRGSIIERWIEKQEQSKPSLAEYLPHRKSPSLPLLLWYSASRSIEGPSTFPSKFTKLSSRVER